MLRSINELYNYVLQAEDGEIGRCKDFLFDDRFWTIRYMVADTGKWLPGRKVLVSPISLGEPNWGVKVFPVRLTKEQIEEAPGLDESLYMSTPSMAVPHSGHFPSCKRFRISVKPWRSRRQAPQAKQYVFSSPLPGMFPS